MSDVITSTSYFSRCDDNAFLFKEKAWQMQQLKAFSQRGFPSRREERWKYTDTRFLATQNFAWAKAETDFALEKNLFASIRLVFINGIFSAQHSDLTQLPPGVVIAPLSEQLPKVDALLLKEFDVNRYPFAVLNSALMTDGLFLSVPADTKIELPIHCLYQTTTSNSVMMHPRNIISLGKNSKLTLIEEYRGVTTQSYFTNAMTTFNLKDNAELDHYIVQTEGLNATHMHSLFAYQEKNSQLKSFNLAKGGHLARTDIQVDLEQMGAACQFYGLYATEKDTQQIDQYLQVNHLAEHGASSMLFKGLLDKKSRATFNGKVYVHPRAQHIRAQQANHNLLLSPLAEVNTKPELEIYADDIKCAHGATVGQLDAESLFYLQARGIEKNLAIELLTRAFSAEIFNKIDNSILREYIERRAGVAHEQ